MKKIYFLIAFLITTVGFSQATDLYFSMYGEGSSNNKFLEIYNGTGADVDLSAYKVELYVNGNDTARYVLEMSGILATGDVYVIAHASADQTILDKADTTSTVCYFNGDDAIALKKNDQLLDVIGVIGEDPGSGWDVAGVSNATKDHTLIRKSSVCSPTTDWAASAGTNADDSQWIVLGKNEGWDEIGSFSGCSTEDTPVLIINQPRNGQEFDPETTEVTVSFTVENFTVAQPSDGDGYIIYALNGDENPYYSTEDFVIDGLTPGDYTLAMKLVDNDGNDLDPAVGDTVAFTIDSYTEVPDLATLRAGNLGEYYKVTGEVIIIGGENYGDRIKGFVQDNTAGIMVYDPDLVTADEDYSLYDGVTGLRGKLAEYRGMLELIPTASPGPPTSTGNTVTPQEVTVTEFNDNHEEYESELIKLTNVQIDTSNGTTFSINRNYDVYDATDTTAIRIMFSALDGKEIPTGTVNITAIGGEYNNSPQAYPRDENDFEAVLALSHTPVEGLRIYPNPVTNGYVRIYTAANGAKTVTVNDLTGKQVWSSHLDANGEIALPLRPGIYLMRVTENGHQSVIKLVVK